MKKWGEKTKGKEKLKFRWIKLKWKQNVERKKERSNEKR